MRRETLTRLNSLRRDRRAAVVLTDLGRGTERLVTEGENVDSALTDVVSAAFSSGKSASIVIDGAQIFVNVYLPPVQIVVIGAVHISQVLAPMARLAGFDLSIIDPRDAFATPERFADTRLIVDWPQDSLQVDPYTALVALAHDPRIDDFPIAAALQAGCFYVGALGSRKSHAARLERLRAEGLTEAQLALIHAPVGLDIGAANPAEIAVAILAEIIKSLRRRALSSAAVKE
jgi:xanthine dehydrogenase accessory factor